MANRKAVRKPTLSEEIYQAKADAKEALKLAHAQELEKTNHFWQTNGKTKTLRKNGNT
jgi:hypothetical protein